MPDVTLVEFNTLNLTANEVYRLITPIYGRYYYWIMNLGPGTLYVRANADPSVGDPESETLPAGAADNQIPVKNGVDGIRVLTDQDGRISVRMKPY